MVSRVILNVEIDVVVVEFGFYAFHATFDTFGNYTRRSYHRNRSKLEECTICIHAGLP